jgi:hypothetical protein
MGYNAPDWAQGAIIASGQVQVFGGANKDKFQGNAGAVATTLTPTVGRTVMEWTIRNEAASAGDLDVWLGAEAGAADMRLGPGESWSPRYAGPVVVKRVTVDVPYRASVVEV